MDSVPENGHGADWPDGVSLVIPAYNEESRIKTALESYVRVLHQIGLPFEVIVVTDGTDRTPEVVESLGEPAVRVLRFDTRQGKGGAIIAGFRVARFRRVGHVDADGSLAPESLVSLVQDAAQFDCVFGSRWVKGSVWVARETLRKELAGRVFNAIVRAVLGVDVKDTQCGAKFYSAPFLQRLLGHVYVNNLTTDVSFVLHAKLLGGSYVEAPVTWTNYDNSRYSLVPMAVTMFATVVGMRIANSRIHALVPAGFVETVHRVVEWAE
jgi:glycosyltransferase involved in cell wall biosynthesis